MSRYKSFDSTGLAPNGRVYAGDLNAIQDRMADLFNLAQSLGVASIAIGENGLQLLRFGAGEARISGSLRTDGILRGLGGLFAGAFSGTQRDAIPAGSRPFTLLIFNTTTNQFEWNAGTDAAPSWQPIAAGIGAGSITNTQIAASAGIQYSKLALALSIVNGDIATAAGIVYSKLNLASSIVHGDIAAANKDGVAGTPSMRTLGTGAQQAAAGNDSRLSDQRVPVDGSVTPAKLDRAYPQVFTAGMKLAQGVATTDGSGNISVTFSPAFTSGVVVVTNVVGSDNRLSTHLTAVSVTGFSAHAEAVTAGAAAGAPVHWIAIGV